MANETKSATYGNHILTEALAARILDANKPKSVISGLVTMDSIAGEPSKTRKINKFSDLGAATTATEGTDFTTNTELNMATPVTLTPTEAAIMRSTITYRAIERRFPGMMNVHSFFDDPSGLSAQLAMAGQEVDRHAAAIAEKVESDLSALLAGFTDSVGSTTVDLSFANMESALFELVKNETPHENWCYVLCPVQMSDLRVAALAATATVFTNNVTDLLATTPDLSRNGLRGSVFGIPVYEISESVKTTANAAADVVGALMLRGQGSYTGGGQDGALIVTEGKAPYVQVDKNLDQRGFVLQSVYEYAAGELDDTYGVKIVTDA